MGSVRAAVFDGTGSFGIREFPSPDPPPDGAVLAVEAVGMCGSDLMQLHGVLHIPGQVSAVVPGHEIVGTISAITSEAERNWGLAEGDRVCVDEIVRCGRCAGCLRGGSCPQLEVYGHTKGPEDEGGLWGGFGEFMRVLPSTHLMRAPEGLSPEELTIFEPLANAINWAQMAGVRWGDVVVVQGPGHQGLLCAAAARVFGADQVIVTGTSEDSLRLDAALQVGATATVVADRDDVISSVRDLTGGQMADVVIDASPAPITAKLAIDLARAGGSIAFAGLKHFTPIPDFTSDLIALKSLTIRGCAGSTPSSMEDAIRFLAQRPDIATLMAGTAVTLETLDHGIALLERRVPGEDTTHVALVHHHDASG